MIRSQFDRAEEFHRKFDANREELIDKMSYCNTIPGNGITFLAFCLVYLS